MTSSLTTTARGVALAILTS